MYRTLKGIVPLQWKVGFHKHKSVPNDIAARVTNRLAGKPAVPSGKLIHLVAGHKSARAFLDGGRSASDAIRGILNKHDLKLNQFGSVLDFGCGVGRIMRHWSTTRGPAWHGTDYNAELIDWCRNNLKFSEFCVNTLSGALPYENDTFDFIYAFSVFTHLNETLQFHWINELSRVLKPGGHIYVTTHGEHYLSILTPNEQQQFHSGQLVVREQQESGRNLCAVFHPPAYVREQVAKNLILADFVPCGAKGDSMHDVHLLKKPSSIEVSK